MHACDAGYVRSAPHASAYLRMRSGTRASSTANDSDAWGSRCADLPATAAGSGIRARKCSCHMEHCQMSRWGSARPRWSRLATRIDISDVDGPRLSTCGRSVDHLQRLGEKRSRKLATARSWDPALRRTIWLHWGVHSGTCAECTPPEGHLWRQSAGSQERAAARSDCIPAEI